MQCEPAGGLSEPTITLSTRDAFAAINQMFGVSGCASVAVRWCRCAAVVTLSCVCGRPP